MKCPCYPDRIDLNETNSELAEDSIVIPFKLKIEDKTLSFMSLITVFGTPNDVVLTEVALETMFQLDKETLFSAKPINSLVKILN